MWVGQNVGHHLVGAGQLDGAEGSCWPAPAWLERKLHSYGTASAVADFRRCSAFAAAAPACSFVGLCPLECSLLVSE